MSNYHNCLLVVYFPILNPPISFQFDRDLQSRWNGAMAAGQFRYDLDHLKTKVIPGPHGYVALVSTAYSSLFPPLLAGFPAVHVSSSVVKRETSQRPSTSTVYARAQSAFQWYQVQLQQDKR